MAHFSTTIRSAAPAPAALDLLADFASVAQWDPGVTEAHLLDGEPGQVGARYRVVAAFGPRRIPLDYVVTERVEPAAQAPGRVTLVAQTPDFTSHDTITVAPEGSGCAVTYDADLRLMGPRRVLDLPLRLAFQVIGRRAEAGLRTALNDLAARRGEPA